MYTQSYRPPALSVFLLGTCGEAIKKMAFAYHLKGKSIDKPESGGHLSEMCCKSEAGLMRQKSGCLEKKAPGRFQECGRP
jgi:hypothetical protein